MSETILSCQPIDSNIQKAYKQSMKALPELQKKLKKANQIAILISLEHFRNRLHTDLELLRALLTDIRAKNPKVRIIVLGNHAGGWFSRLLFRLTGIKQLLHHFKAKMVFLDENRVVKAKIGPADDCYEVSFPYLIVNELRANRSSWLFINLANLRTNSVTTLQSGMANLLNLIARPSRALLYTLHIHRLIVDVANYLAPDITILDANQVFVHGLVPPLTIQNEFSINIERLIVSPDVVAAERVAIELLGIEPETVQHFVFATELNLGNGNLDAIRVMGQLEAPTFQIPTSPLISVLPPHVDVVIGQNNDADSPLLAQALELINIIHRDFGGTGYFSLMLGKDFHKSQFIHLREPIVMLGEQACKQLGEQFYNQKLDVYFLRDGSYFDQLIAVLTRVMRVGRYQYLGVNPVSFWRSLIWARLHGLHYRIPRIRFKTYQYK